MFLKLYRATQVYSWYDITLAGNDPDTGEYSPGHGEKTTIKYGYAIKPSWFQREDGGQGGRKDGYDITTTVERVKTLPDECELVNQPNVQEWLKQVQQGIFGARRWDWLMRPRRYWLPKRLSNGVVITSGLHRDVHDLWHSFRNINR